MAKLSKENRQIAEVFQSVHPAALIWLVVIASIVLLAPFFLLAQVARYAYELHSSFVLSVVVLGVVGAVLGLASVSRGIKGLAAQIMRLIDPDVVLLSEAEARAARDQQDIAP